jgi:Ca2+-binding EF-hand superfamily protein
LREAFSFEDVLQTMSISKPGAHTQIKFDDFLKVVENYSKGEFSKFAIQQVFKAHAEIDSTEDGYIKIGTFKDLFYPKKKW